MEHPEARPHFTFFDLVSQQSALSLPPPACPWVLTHQRQAEPPAWCTFPERVLQPPCSTWWVLGRSHSGDEQGDGRQKLEMHFLKRAAGLWLHAAFSLPFFFIFPALRLIGISFWELLSSLLLLWDAGTQFRCGLFPCNAVFLLVSLACCSAQLFIASFLCWFALLLPFPVFPYHHLPCFTRTFATAAGAGGSYTATCFAVARMYPHLIPQSVPCSFAQASRPAIASSGRSHLQLGQEREPGIQWNLKKMEGQVGRVPWSGDVRKVLGKSPGQSPVAPPSQWNFMEETDLSMKKLLGAGGGKKKVTIFLRAHLPEPSFAGWDVPQRQQRRAGRCVAVTKYFVAEVLWVLLSALQMPPGLSPFRKLSKLQVSLSCLHLTGGWHRAAQPSVQHRHSPGALLLPPSCSLISLSLWLLVSLHAHLSSYLHAHLHAAQRGLGLAESHCCYSYN